MTEVVAAPARFYVTGGTVPPGHPSYVKRPADDELYERCLAGDFCYVLTTRQMGKSSLMAHTAVRLRDAGVRTALVDLTMIGGEGTTADQWYYGVADQVLHDLELGVDLEAWWDKNGRRPPLQRLTRFLRDVVLESCPDRIVIFVDEIDTTIRLPFSDDFFAAIRACHNARANDVEFNRLTFVLVGVATPDQLISDTARTPFNLGHPITLDDFAIGEMGPLAEGFGDTEQIDAVLERIFYWTDGHPYLTQRLSETIARANGDRGISPTLIDRLVHERFLDPGAHRRDSNLEFVRRRLTAPGQDLEDRLGLYLKIVRGGELEDEPLSPIQTTLKLAGVVKADPMGRVQVRNRIYKHVFDEEWAIAESPREQIRRSVRHLNEMGAQVADLGDGFGVALGLQVDLRTVLPDLEKLRPRSLSLIRNPVSDVSGLGRLRSLKKLDLQKVQVSDVSALAGLSSLRALNLGGTKVSDVSALARLSSLTWLNLAGTRVSDVRPLAEIASLEWLNLFGTNASDVSGLAGLSSLKELELGDTSVSDVSVLATLPSLQSLGIMYTQVSEEEVEKLRKALPDLEIRSGWQILAPASTRDQAPT